jgi:3-oxoacyl-[acyl-carrier protein] reductase
MDRLQGKVALITGATSGFGRESALLFARNGAHVAVVGQNSERGAETVARIEELGGSAIFIRADVADCAQAAQMVKTTVNHFGRLDILFNNAGVPMSWTPVSEITEEQYARIMDVNLKGTIFGCKYGAPEIARSGGGSIINSASLAGIKGRPNLSIYCASKGAVVALTKSLAVELAPARIRVNSICAVASDTPMLPKFALQGLQRSTADAFKATAEAIPMKRLGAATDTANLALFLAGDDSAFITGLNIPLDGGFSA